MSAEISLALCLALGSSGLLVACLEGFVRCEGLERCFLGSLPSDLSWRRIKGLILRKVRLYPE